MNKVLVTGGAGYIGSHFVRQYLKANPDVEIVIVDDLSEGHEASIKDLPRTVFIKENIGNQNAMIKIFRGHKIQTVVHFAAHCYVGESQVSPEKYFENNTINTLRMFAAMEECGVREIVFSSTCATYGNPEYSPIDEKHPQAPINVYGSTKLMIEQALRAYSLSKDWSYVALRYFNATGADEESLIGEDHDPETHIIPLALNVAAGKSEAIKIYGDDYDTPDGTCIRDYIHVNDLASAHIAAIDYLRKHPGGQVFNLGTGAGVSVQEIIETCKKVAKKDIPIEIVGRRPGDPARLVADASKAKELLGWETGYDLEDIVKTAWAWHSKNPSGYK